MAVKPIAINYLMFFELLEDVNINKICILNLLVNHITPSRKKVCYSNSLLAYVVDDNQKLSSHVFDLCNKYPDGILTCFF